MLTVLLILGTLLGVVALAVCCASGREEEP